MCVFTISAEELRNAIDEVTIKLEYYLCWNYVGIEFGDSRKINFL